MVIDPAGMVYLVWAEQAEGEAPVLMTSRWDGTVFSLPLPIFGGEEGALQPALAIDSSSYLHLVWITGQGALKYSNAIPEQAEVLGGWAPEQDISAHGQVAVHPQLAVDPSGVVYLAYVIPINENRGVYLSKLESNTWGDATRVFDAAAAGWEQVDHPAFAISSDGVLHLAWARTGLPGLSEQVEIYYAQSRDGGATWSEQTLLLETDYRQPQLVSTSGYVHLLAVGADGDLAYRWLDLFAGDQAVWSPRAAVNPWRSSQCFEVVSAGFLAAHLVAPPEQIEPLYYSLAGSGSQMSWQSTNPSSEVELAQLEPSPTCVIAASARAELGILAAAWVSVLDDTYSIHSSYLSVPVIQPAGLPAHPPTPEASNDPAAILGTPTIDLSVPTPVPVLSQTPFQPQDGFSPILIGMGLAGGSVVFIFAIYVVIKSTKVKG
jgi:hypothetical protein